MGQMGGFAVAAFMIAAAPLSSTELRRNSLHIDVPVVLQEAKVVFNIDRPAFSGDEPTGLKFLRVMTERFRAEQTNARIVAIFHGEAGYMLLDDAAYNRVRRWQRGNPFKEQIATLQRAGVEVEECGQTMEDNNWGNAELLPGIKVNSGANFRIVQLTREGFVQLQP